MTAIDGIVLWGVLNQRPFFGEERKTSARAECF